MKTALEIYPEIFRFAEEQVKEAGVLPYILGGSALFGTGAALGKLLGKEKKEGFLANLDPRLALGAGFAAGMAAPSLLKGLSGSNVQGLLSGLLGNAGLVGPVTGYNSEFTEI